MSIVKLIYKTYLCTSKQYWLKMRYSTRINKFVEGCGYQFAPIPISIVSYYNEGIVR